MLILANTRPFARFIKRVGHSTFHINAAYIGLEWIARGKGKPEDLDIHWPIPKNSRSAVDQSRLMLHAAMLGYVSDSLDSYLRLLAGVKWLPLSEQQRDILRKSVTRPNGSAYAIWERFANLGLDLTEDGKVDLNLARVLVAWRNMKMHEGLEDSDNRLDSDVETTLIAAGENLSSRYGGLKPSDMFSQMHGNYAPRRKEIVGLVSACVNLTRLVDKTIVANAIKCESDLELIAFAEISAALGGKDGNVEGGLKKLWGKDEHARQRRIAFILEDAQFKLNAEKDEIGLPDNFAAMLACANPDTILNKEFGFWH